MSYWKTVCLGCALFAAMTIASAAQTFTTLAYFPYFSFSSSALIQGRDGNLYGTTQAGGTGGWGTLFKVTRSGTLTNLYTFCSLANCADGWSPMGALALGVDGDLYGTTARGGENDHGTIFKVSPSGALRVLYTFSGTDGSGPEGGLILASDGRFYGTTSGGGTSPSCIVGCGTVFKITPGGSLTTLFNFNEADGYGPAAPLIQGNDGNFYGTTLEGGIQNSYCIYGCGTVFKMTPAGRLTTAHYFDFTDGSYIGSAVTQGSDGNFYAPAWEGGYVAFEGCFNGCGTLFSISQKGKFTILQKPQSPAVEYLATLVVASDGKLYGISAELYTLDPSGKVTIVYTLPPNLATPNTVLQATDGMFYGTYLYDDDTGSAVYSLDTGLSPFVTFVVPAGKAGQTAQILSQGFTGTTSVTFNGVPAASFKVVSDTYMTAVVPAGATTGAVVVATPAGNLSSNVSFRVTR